jgi:hypothetical protein
MAGAALGCAASVLGASSEVSEAGEISTRRSWAPLNYPLSTTWAPR